MSGFISYVSGKYEITRRYTVEYIDDPEKWQRICDENCAPHEPWELYLQREYADVGDALTFYLCCLFNDRVFDVKLFSQLFVNGDLVEEAYIEPDSTLYSSLARLINTSREAELSSLKENTAWQAKVLDYYDTFIKSNSLARELLNVHMNKVAPPAEIWYNTIK